MTQDGVRSDVSSILDALGYVRAVDDFDFDKQPSQQIDKAYRVRLTRADTIPEMGLGQIEIHRLEVWLARQAGGDDAIDACRSLTVDFDLIEQTLVNTTVTGDRFNLVDDTVETEGPDSGGDHVVGMLACEVDFDRDLTV